MGRVGKAIRSEQGPLSSVRCGTMGVVIGARALLRKVRGLWDMVPMGTMCVRGAVMVCSLLIEVADDMDGHVDCERGEGGEVNECDEGLVIHVHGVDSVKVMC